MKNVYIMLAIMTLSASLQASEFVSGVAKKITDYSDTIQTKASNVVNKVQTRIGTAKPVAASTEEVATTTATTAAAEVAPAPIKIIARGQEKAEAAVAQSNAGTAALLQREKVQNSVIQSRATQRVAQFDAERDAVQKQYTTPVETLTNQLSSGIKSASLENTTANRLALSKYQNQLQALDTKYGQTIQTLAQEADTVAKDRQTMLNETASDPENLSNVLSSEPYLQLADQYATLEAQMVGLSRARTPLQTSLSGIQSTLAKWSGAPLPAEEAASTVATTATAAATAPGALTTADVNALTSSTTPASAVTSTAATLSDNPFATETPQGVQTLTTADVNALTSSTTPASAATSAASVLPDNPFAAPAATVPVSTP